MALPASTATTSVEFEKLLSRDYQPSQISRLQVKPLPAGLFHPRAKKKPPQTRPPQLEHENGLVEYSGGESSLLDKNDHRMMMDDANLPQEQRDLLFQVTSLTPAFLQHLSETDRENVLQKQNELLHNNNNQSTLYRRQRKHHHQPTKVPPQFSALEMTNWADDVDWGEEEDDDNKDAMDGTAPKDDNKHVKATTTNTQDLPAMDNSLLTSSNPQHQKLMSQLSPLAREALQHRRNPALEQLNLLGNNDNDNNNDNNHHNTPNDDFYTVVVGDVDEDDLLAQAAATPLRLELGVAGSSVALQRFQASVPSAQHPSPAVLNWAYQARVERQFNAEGGGRGGKNADDSLADILGTAGTVTDVRKLTKKQYDALIAARSKKREQMAKDKTNRVMQAMGTLGSLGGGKGRAITSSLMGPGGTERTGRPSRHMNAAGTVEHEYIEQVDVITSHALVRDLSKVLLREFHRPKLPRAVVRQDLSWQFQIRFSATSRKAEGAPTDGRGVPTSPYHQRSGGMMNSGLMVGGVGGTPTIRTEADLSPSDGKLVLVEYSEERPPILLGKGMCFKIINYYRGEKTHCPVSAGGGDRPARRKRNDEGQSGSGAGGAGDASQGGKKRGSKQDQMNQTLPRLNTSNASNNILDWIGPLPKKDPSKAASGGSGDANAERSIDILPEGVTEILHPSSHGPFLGEVPDGSTLTGLISNLYVAPMFRHEPEATDFLMILTPPSGATRAGQRESMGVILRDFPKSVYTVGQVEPCTRVHAPGTPGEKAFTSPFVSYQIARAITRSQSREGHGLRLDELQARVLPNLELPGNAFRQRLKHVAIYDKNTQIWTTKPLGFEGYQGVEALGKSISPEGVAAFETTCAASRRLADLGIHQLFSGTNTAASVGVCCIYMAGQLNAFRELSKKMKKLVEISRSQKHLSSLQGMFHERASTEIEAVYKVLKNKYEVAQFIHEELQLAPWHLTGEFLDVHKKAEGTGMMKLTGLGDPSGGGGGFSFLREADSKPSKSVGNSALNAQVKKITGTEDDLRKLTMPQMASLLRSYGMAQKQIDTLKRWDRVHCIRDLSTKAASDGTGDGLERFARGEKLKLSEQKQMYRDRIQEIWRRQIAALSQSDTGDKGGGDDAGGASDPAAAAAAAQPAQAKKAADTDDDSDSEFDEDDFANDFEQEMMNQTEANQLISDSRTGGGGEPLRGAAAQDKELNKDAREFTAFRRALEEEKAAQEGMRATADAGDVQRHVAAMANRKVIRRKITKTYPDGRQTTTFKFILHPDEVGKIEARLSQKKDEERPKMREWNYEKGLDEKPPGHAMFEDEDDFDYSSRSGRMTAGKRRGAGGRKRGDGRVTPRGRGALQFGKLKNKTSKEERMRKRKREEEELEVYNAQAKRKSTNNRRERGSIRDRRPHVIFAEKLEAIRSAVESRPYAAPFKKPVNRKLIPRYYEMISNPIDLATMRNKINGYEYRKADALLEDFALMKSNAIKFNGQGNQISQEAIAIYDFVRDQIQASQSELSALEAAVEEQMSTKPKKKRKGAAGKKKKASGSGSPMSVGGGGTTADIAGVTINLGDVQQFDDSDSGEEDDNFLGL